MASRTRASTFAACSSVSVSARWLSSSRAHSMGGPFGWLVVEDSVLPAVGQVLGQAGQQRLQRGGAPQVGGGLGLRLGRGTEAFQVGRGYVHQLGLGRRFHEML